MSDIIKQILAFLQNLFYLKYLPNIHGSRSLAIIFVFGILTSFHCIAMCGGILLSQGVMEVKKGSFKAFFKYNLGRIISYSILGGIIGEIGHLIKLPGIFAGIVPIFGGIFMIIMGINFIGIFPSLRKLNIRIPAFAVRILIKGKDYNSFCIGILSGFMPCGPLQIMQLYVLAAGSFFLGVLSMFVFVLGTMPLITVFILINSVIGKRHLSLMLKVSAVVVIILGFQMLGRGFSLSGIRFNLAEEDQNLSTLKNKNISVAKIHGKEQSVTTEMGSNSFPEIVVQKGIPVKWLIKVKEKNLNSCNKSMIIKKFNIEKEFKVGDNFVEFTPNKCGVIEYTCWMAMIKSKIIVIDDINKVGF